MSYTALMEKWQDLEPKLLPAILDYYIEERQALGYDIEPNEDFPPITTTDELAKHIEFACITVPWARENKGRRIGLLFGCTWEEEHGLGILLVNEEISKVGYQDVAL